MTRNRRQTTLRRKCIIERTDRADKLGADEGMDFGTGLWHQGYSAHQGAAGAGMGSMRPSRKT